MDFFGKTLVVHIFADTDPEYLENLKFFVHYGILKKDIAAEYVIIVQSDTSATVKRATLLLTCRLLLSREFTQHLVVCSSTGFLHSLPTPDTLCTPMNATIGAL